ncbi:MAG: type ISP restriction/modification enzyme [Phycisphaerales bacterium]
MAKSLSITPASKPVKAYYTALRGFAEQNVEHEQAVRSAFQTLLAELARAQKWTAIPELGKKVRVSGKRTRIIPDGTIKDRYQLPRGYWEAKDSADDLDAEIADKIRKGYPLDNSIFWTPTRAVLFQAGQKKLDVAIAEANGQPGAFCDLLTAFFTFVDQPIVDFDDAVEEFTTRVPEVGKKLAEIIADAHKSNRTFKERFAAFFDLCRTTLNPNISQVAVDEMLVQHLLTERLFQTVFSNPDFARKNVIAAEVEKVIDALTSRAFSRKEFLSSLDRFYIAIENAASRVPDWSSKQAFLNSVYERFFQGYCVKTADTHGIVYTPQPIVDFMCASVEWVLKEEFGKALGDDGVNILDPCTGTGNFVVNLMRRAAERGPKHLRRMYTDQLFANEIMLMPYYIAALNIEHEFFDLAGEYEPFEGLCFVDTLDLAEPKTLGLFTEANLARVDRQKKSPITVVIGNPPYNVGQMIHNEQNQNRPYSVIDARVRSTYSAASNATSVSKLNDPYVKFFRWATDRLGERPGIVTFVSNNGFVEALAFDGFRKHLARDFGAIYHFNLRGNARTSALRRKLEGGNVFSDQIRVGIGITVLVRHKTRTPTKVHYHEVPDRTTAVAKQRYLTQFASIGEVPWRKLKPNQANVWLNQGEGEVFPSCPALVSKDARASSGQNTRALFQDYSLGVATHRDTTVYDWSRESLEPRVKSFIEEFNTEVDRWKRAPKGADVHSYVRYDKLAWDRDLKNDVVRGRYAAFDKSKTRSCLYRPYCRQNLFFDRVLNAEVYGWPSLSPIAATEQHNRIIAFTGPGSEKPFMAMCGRGLFDLHLVGAASGCQCVSFFVYDSEGANPNENMSSWGLDLFGREYAPNKVAKWDIFHYVYAILHHNGYRETFADNLKRELPRIPLAKAFDEFRAFATAGEALAKLHLHYDDEKIVKPHKLREVWTLTDAEGRKRSKSWRVDDKMRLSKDQTTLTVNSTLSLHDIPPAVYRYRLGNRSALEWVIDQYQVSTDKRTGIVSDANAWGEERDDPEYIVRLVKQVVTVSLETMKLVDNLPKDFGGPPNVQDADRATPQPEDPPAKPARRSGKDRFQLRGQPDGKQGRLRPSN